jgi:phosphoribosylamine-glycine ligase
VPPPSKSTDEEVQAFVRGNAAAIGYVGPESALVEGVKVLKLRD